MRLLEWSDGAGSGADEPLIARFVADKDLRALGEIIRRYSPRLRGLLATMLRGSAEDLADAEQEVFLTLVQKAHMFRGRSGFSTFFYSLARNRILDLIRSQSRYSSRNSGETDFTLVASNEPGPEARALDNERRERIYRALDVLSPKDRFLVYMKDAEGTAIRELSEIVGMRENTVKSRLRRARERLAKELEGEDL
jgi:RNA polymerase sigma-70 factor (ECF subfamily)